MASADTIVQICKEYDEIPVMKLSEDDALSFLSSVSFESLFSLFSSGEVDASQVDIVCSALAKVFSSSIGQQALRQSSHMLEAARASEIPALRRLVAEVTGSLLLSNEGPEGQETLLVQLFEQMKDTNIGVASAASRALFKFATKYGTAGVKLLLRDGSETLAAVSDLVHSKRSVERVRGMSLLVELSSLGQEAYDAVLASGILDSILRELSNTSDPLACLSTLALLQDLAATPEGALGLAGPFGQLVAGPVVSMLQQSELLLGALPLSADLVRSVVDRGAGDLGSSIPLLQHVADILDDTKDASVEAEEAALDAVCRLSSSRRGAELVASSSDVLGRVLDRALGRSPSPGVRVAALHAAASVAGQERTVEYNERAAALLSEQAEASLMTAVYAGAISTSPSATPGEVFSTFLQNPINDMRIALCRLLAALVIRPWAAAEVCRHAGLLERLLAPDVEAEPSVSRWRHACCASLLATVNAYLASESVTAPHRPLFLAVSASLQSAAKAGPFGRAVPVTMHQTHFVAAKHR